MRCANAGWDATCRRSFLPPPHPSRSCADMNPPASQKPRAWKRHGSDQHEYGKLGLDDSLAFRLGAGRLCLLHCAREGCTHLQLPAWQPPAAVLSLARSYSLCSLPFGFPLGALLSRR